MDGWMDGWMDGRMDGWMEGWKDGGREASMRPSIVADRPVRQQNDEEDEVGEPAHACMHARNVRVCVRMRTRAGGHPRRENGER